MVDPAADPSEARRPLKPLTLFDKAAYGFGSVAYGVKDNGFGVLLMLYYNQVVGMPAARVGLALLIVLCIDAIVDPIIGYVSDNTRSRFGRRHPYMYAAAIPVALAYLALWMPPSGLSEDGLFVYLVLVASAIRICISFNEIPSSSLGPELSHDYDERTTLMSFRYFFGWWGGLTMSVLAFSVFLRPTAEQPVGQLNQLGYLHYGLASSAIMLVAILGSALGTHRHIKRFTPPPKRRIDLKLAAREMAQTLRNKAFILLTGATFFGYAFAGLYGSMVVYLRTYFWELSAAQIGLLTLSNFASTLAGLFIAPWLSARFGKKRAAMGVAVLAIVTTPLIYILRFFGWLPPNGTELLFVILFTASFLTSVLLMLSGVFGSSMFADVVEDSALKTGRRNEGVFFAANSFVMQCVSGVGLFLTGVVLTLAAFPEGAQPGQVPDSVLYRLMFIEMGFVTVLLLGNLLFISLFPITRAKHEANLARLGAKTPADPTLEPARVAATAERRGTLHPETISPV
jgi:Na+/melibiose symporter-like transporter